MDVVPFASRRGATPARAPPDRPVAPRPGRSAARNRSFVSVGSHAAQALAERPPARSPPTRGPRAVDRRGSLDRRGEVRWDVKPQVPVTPPMIWPTDTRPSWGGVHEFNFIQASVRVLGSSPRAFGFTGKHPSPFQPKSVACCAGTCEATHLARRSQLCVQKSTDL